MSKNYFVEYAKFLNRLQNRIMRIQLRYNECISWIRTDMRNGVLPLELGEELLKLRMDEHKSDIDPKYCLSLDDVNFLKKYADLDANGQVLSTFLKREYLDKAEKMGDILEAVKVFDSLNSLGETNARLSVIKDISEHYQGELQKIDVSINQCLNFYGENAKHTTKYMNLVKRKEEIEKALKAFGQIENAPQDIFIRIVSQFYDVKYSYYEWYLKMQLKQEYEEGTVYSEHYNVMDTLTMTANDMVSNTDQAVALNEELEKANQFLFSTLEGLAEFNFEAVYDYKKPKKRLFSTVELNNRENLMTVFINLVSIFGVKKFIGETFGNGDSSVSLNEAFNVYFNQKYGEDTSYVDPNQFLNDFRNAIIVYYKELIADLIRKINELNKEINTNSLGMCGNIRLAFNQARLQKEISEQFPAKREELFISGFTSEDLDKLYIGLKEFIGNGYNFGLDEEAVTFRKV